MAGESWRGVCEVVRQQEGQEERWLSKRRVSRLGSPSPCSPDPASDAPKNPWTQTYHGCRRRRLVDLVLRGFDLGLQSMHTVTVLSLVSIIVLSDGWAKRQSLSPPTAAAAAGMGTLWLLVTSTGPPGKMSPDIIPGDMGPSLSRIISYHHHRCLDPAHEAFRSTLTDVAQHKFSLPVPALGPSRRIVSSALANRTHCVPGIMALASCICWASMAMFFCWMRLFLPLISSWVFSPNLLHIPSPMLICVLFIVNTEQLQCRDETSQDQMQKSQRAGMFYSTCDESWRTWQIISRPHPRALNPEREKVIEPIHHPVTEAGRGGGLWNALAPRAGKGAEHRAMPPRTFPAAPALTRSGSACTSVFMIHARPMQPSFFSTPVSPVPTKPNRAAENWNNVLLAGWANLHSLSGREHVPLWNSRQTSNVSHFVSRICVIFIAILNTAGGGDGEE
ncbi:hypothetical protein EYF80_009325 [Liparis tanakae]|uniref:Uncharacterized protein n=1 Tax=Liparis tanakae TaxID=230148 RepID=A0A4Z2IR47_9TELE|nr:hypothetical protein EYF80_009325 [Liparis tanakae]